MFRMTFGLLALGIACLADYSFSAEEGKKNKQSEEVGTDLVQFLMVGKTSSDLKAAEIEFALCNVSDKPLIVHTDYKGRLTLAQVWLYQDDGKMVEGNDCTSSYVYPRKDVRTLKPGERISLKEDISYHYGKWPHFELKPGRYEIRISYNSHMLVRRFGLTPIRIHKRLVGYLDVEDSEEKIEKDSKIEKDIEENAKKEAVGQ